MQNDPLAAANVIKDLIAENRDETEAKRQLAEPIVEALIDTRLCRMALPVENGGLETSPLDAFAVYETLAAAEASVAWIAWNNSLVCSFARFLSPEVREEIFGDPSRLYANSTRPSDTRSSVAIRSAMRAGWLYRGGMRAIPWPSRIFFVRWLAAARNTSGADE